MKVGNGEGIAVLCISHAELPLEVGAPQLIRGLDVLFSKRGIGMIAPSFGSLLNQPVAIQQIVNRAPDRQFHLWMLALEHLVDLRCSPCRFLTFQVQTARLISRRYLTREPSRPARKIIKSLRPLLFIALLKFVAGLARDSKFAAQIRHPLACLQASHKLHSFVHCGNLFPGHGPSSTPVKVLPMSPVIFVTYLSGLHLKFSLHIAEC